MTKNVFPEKPNYQFTSKQISRRNRILSKEVEHITFDDLKYSSQLIEAFSKSSFQARQIGTGAKLYKTELETKTTIIWSLAGSLFSAGLRQLVIDSVRNNLVDCLVCTGALFEQDMLEALGYKHYVLNEEVEDKTLQNLMIDRVYDHVLDELELQHVDLTYKKIAKEMQPGNYSSREFMNVCGQWLSEAKESQDSVMQAAYEMNVPIFIPALNDCSIGIGLAMNQVEKEDSMSIDSIKDLREIAMMKKVSGNSGLIIVGGGVPKNYSQDSVVMAEMLGFNVRKHKFGIQISTADSRDGGLSGSTLKEAISWGKNDSQMDEVMIWGEASVYFPLLLSYVQNINGRDKKELNKHINTNMLQE
ncbi:MAG: deoxyhypusine synthase family protein [Candidatus Poseidoniales archaeon]